MLVRKLYYCCLLLFALCCYSSLTAQVVINEGSNRNYQSIADENGDYPDWIELYNAGPDTVSLYNYSLTDNEANPAKWVFPNIAILPGEHKLVFCSGKDRKPISGFVNVINTGVYNPVTGWNVHNFSAPFYWDGVSSILLSTCSYNSTGYTSNSVFNQTITPFRSSVFSFQDGSEAACFAAYGGTSYMRPNIQLNGITIGTGTAQNSPTDYPAPYGNWWWGAKNQMLYLATELTAAGLTAGLIQSIAFDVVSTDPNTVYNYIDLNMKPVSFSEVNSAFETIDPNNRLHTNFKIDRQGEKISLYSPNQ
ncbi:MAG TPA: lamin tail domain-containing protein, partial [Chitinophagales bacterium]|nr:lamin tail domain-containing protein [Chitinophagales bacterium]